MSKSKKHRHRWGIAAITDTNRSKGIHNEGWAVVCVECRMMFPTLLIPPILNAHERRPKYVYVGMFGQRGTHNVPWLDGKTKIYVRRKRP